MNNSISSPESSGSFFEPLLILIRWIILALVDNDAKVADLLVLAHVSAMLGVLVHPVRRHHDIEHIIQQVHLQNSIHLSRGGQRRRGIDFQQPGFQGSVYEDIITVALKAMLVVDDDTLH